MANRAYLRVWTRDFSETTMIAQFARFLTTAPLPESRPYFDELVAQAVDPTEPPVAEWDVHDGTFGAPEIAALAAQNLNADTAYIVYAKWELWTFDVDTMKWKRGPQPLVLTCNGMEYDNGAAASEGHFVADLGFEHLFTGHGGILAPAAATNPFDNSDHPIERTFRSWMSVEANRREYAGRTRENIQYLMNWVEAVSRALPVERSELWSEGEENFEARLDAILALR
ncbi:MAG TPA: hypothetical protein VKP58_15255 [Candidatus Acidoferrum sp.]|nr:hypothetical protein [Candidatus Acidoferrum sp.]